MPTLHSLSTGKTIIYIATRLFDYAEKIKAEDIDQAVKKGVNRAMYQANIVPVKGVSPTFVPFRDTSQKGGGRASAQNIGGDQSTLNHRIYLEDTERLKRSFALIGFFDGLSKDEGVCMELGYAYGIERPIILVLTDFVRADFENIPNSEHLVDPVIEAMASKIIYQYSIPDNESSFKEQLQAALEMLYSNLEEETYSLCLAKNTEEDRPQTVMESSNRYDVCIDFGGGLFEWQRLLQEQLAQSLIRRGLSCVIGNRYSHYVNYANDVSIMELGRRDIGNAQASTIVVTCSDTTEMSSGTAALQGYSCALGKKVLLYNSKTTHMVGDLQYRSSRNLMIDHSATSTVSKFEDLPNAVENLLRD